MNKHQYIPAPADTSAIALPQELEALAEDLARNVHEVWAAQRMADGWTWGPERDDAARKHPCLVPYDELPESEKDYDRSTSQETLKLILSLGFDIVRK
ncbi:MAG: Ryanodine receptor Ryr [Muribaculaceae bacterium]|nr:Ryanodine receptor Ryr [Muribaculaceae bacterium]